MDFISRRRLLTTAAALPLAIPLALPLGPGALQASGVPRTLVLVELNGGNDGLNTVVPYREAAYYRARPTLAVPADRVLQLDQALGLHPALEPLMPAWQDKDLAIALGVGYPRPNRSHFRSIEIWNTASDSAEVLHQGWLHQALQEAGEQASGAGRLGIVLGGATGPLAGDALTTVVMKNRQQLARAAGLPENQSAASGNPALDHILSVRRQTHDAANRIAARLAKSSPLKTVFPKTSLGRQLAQAAAMIAGAVPASVIKVQQGGYDTHAGQAGRHPRLLGELAAALAAFREALIETGSWQRCLVMTYAEFGRRVGENASGGTDHGTAAPHLFMGARLRGGLLGRQPSLTDLEDGDLRHSLDFRRLYASVAADWLGLPRGLAAFGPQPPLDLFT